MGNTKLLTKAVALVRYSPFLTAGQKSLYVSRFHTVSEEKLVQVIAFLEAQHVCLRQGLRRISPERFIKQVSLFFSEPWRVDGC